MYTESVNNMSMLIEVLIGFIHVFGSGCPKIHLLVNEHSNMQIIVLHLACRPKSGAKSGPNSSITKSSITKKKDVSQYLC